MGPILFPPGIMDRNCIPSALSFGRNGERVGGNAPNSRRIEIRRGIVNIDFGLYLLIMRKATKSAINENKLLFTMGVLLIRFLSK